MSCIFTWLYRCITFNISIILYTCAECDNGFFGSGCEKVCQCEMKEHCAKDSGACPGLCAAGWNGTDCQTGWSHYFHFNTQMSWQFLPSHKATMCTWVVFCRCHCVRLFLNLNISEITGDRRLVTIWAYRKVSGQNRLVTSLTTLRHPITSYQYVFVSYL